MKRIQTLLLLFLCLTAPLMAKDAKYDRGIEMKTFIPKGQWMVGATFSYSEHVDNNFSPIPEEYCRTFVTVRDELVAATTRLAQHFKDRDYEAMRTEEETLASLQKKFSDLRKALMVDIQSKNLNLTVAYLYLNIIQESEQLCISLKHYARASRKLA